MTRRIVLTDSPTRRVGLKAAPVRRVSSATLLARLGAETVEDAPPQGGSPSHFASIREEIFNRLRSTGGRPGLEGVERKKIPFTQKDWKAVEQVADHISEPGFTPSAGQVASVLLSIALREMTPSLEAIVKRDLKVTKETVSRS